MSQGQHALAETYVKPNLLNLLPIGILEINSDGIVSRVMGSAERLLGLSKQKLVGLSLEKALPEHNFLFSLWHRCLKDGRRISQYDVDISGRTAPEHCVDIHVEPLNPASTDMILMTLCPRPTPQVSSIHTPMPATQRIIENLSSVLAHEIRNPLAGIKGAAQLIEQTSESSNTQLTKLIEREVDRISTLVQQLEKMSLVPDTPPTGVNVHEVIKHVHLLMDDVLYKKGIQITWTLDFDPSLPDALAGQKELIQILVNLVKNAIEACTSDTLNLTIRSRYRFGIIRSLADHQTISLPIEIEIEDDGPGISGDISNHLFEPFITSKEAGKGLGLSLAAYYVDWMHGSLVYYHPAHGGAGFRMNLPQNISPKSGVSEMVQKQ